MQNSGFALTALLCLFVLFVIVVSEPSAFGLMGPETGSRSGRLPDPCSDNLAVQTRQPLYDPVTGARLVVPHGNWRPDPRADSWRTARWRNADRYEMLRVELLDHYPGRPRIEYTMHGIGELERCKVPWGKDSAWIATGFAMNNPDYRAVIAILPQDDGRWLKITGVTEDDRERQLEWLVAVRTAWVD